MKDGEPTGRSRPLILIVDDEPMNIRVIAHELIAQYEVMVATNGDDALDILSRDEKPDLILLDLMMPGMDGFTLCKRVREMERVGETPIIVASARDMVADQRRAFDLGAVDFVTKPIELSLLLARIRVHIRLRQKTERLEALAMIDGLTDIANRRALEETLERECRRAAREHAPLSVIMIDIDHFKEINDFLGHGVGDEYLRKITESLRSTLMRAGDFLARYGGEEFAAILPNCLPYSATLVAEHLRKGVEDLRLPRSPMDANGTVVTISLGLSGRVGDQGEIDAGALFREADSALYESKREGRNRVVAYRKGGEAAQMAADSG